MLAVIMSVVIGVIIGTTVDQYTHAIDLALAAGAFATLVILFQIRAVILLEEISNKLPTSKPKEKLETDLESQINDRWD